MTIYITKNLVTFLNMKKIRDFILFMGILPSLILFDFMPVILGKKALSDYLLENVEFFKDKENLILDSYTAIGFIIWIILIWRLI